MRSLSKAVRDRLYPSRFQFDYIVLTDLRTSITSTAQGISGRILDYGCGLKPYSALFPNATEYIGADFSSNLDADIHLDGSGGLPLEVSGFNAVVSFQVLEHVPDMDLYLGNCRQALDPQTGTLLLTTHGIWEYHPCPHDLYRWTHEGLAATIERHGFTTLAIEPVTTGIRSILQLIALRAERALRIPQPVKARFNYVINSLADLWSEHKARDVRLQELPICYLYLGRLRI